MKKSPQKPPQYELHVRYPDGWDLWKAGTLKSCRRIGKQFVNLKTRIVRIKREIVKPNEVR